IVLGVEASADHGAYPSTGEEPEELTLTSAPGISAPTPGSLTSIVTATCISEPGARHGEAEHVRTTSASRADTLKSASVRSSADCAWSLAARSAAVYVAPPCNALTPPTTAARDTSRVTASAAKVRACT